MRTMPSASQSGVQELLSDLAAALDPVVFAHSAGITPDDWQAAFLRSQVSQRILLCSRQAGKSTVSAVLAIHEALYSPGALVLLLSPSLRQSKELYGKVKAFYAAAGEPVPAEVENKLELVLTNGSRVVCLPGKEATIRGFSGVALLIVDEASRVPDELYQAVRPMLAVSRGRIILLSTPFGKRGFFFQEWTEGGSDWHRTKITAHDIPRIDQAWLEAERRNIPRSIFEQEYECVFGELEDAAFSYDDIRAAVNPNLEPLFTTGAPQ